MNQLLTLQTEYDFMKSNQASQIAIKQYVKYVAASQVEEFKKRRLVKLLSSGM